MVKHGKKTNMNNTTRAVIATAAIGALLIPLAGCGNTTTSSGKTELTVWSWDTSIDRAAKSFMKANPDITVKVSNPGGTDETYTALNNAAQAGSGLPDVTLIEYLAIPQFVHSDTLMELSKVLRHRQAQEDVHPRHMELREHQRRPVRDARRLGPHGLLLRQGRV